MSHSYSVCIIKSIFYFFFSSRRRHTRSKRDWSSDVCSSDLNKRNAEPQFVTVKDGIDLPVIAAFRLLAAKLNARHPILLKRSEERRVGKECRSRWSRYH